MALEQIKEKINGLIQKLKSAKKHDAVYDDVEFVDPQSERALRELERQKNIGRFEDLRIRH